MTDRELERKLANALEHAAPNDLEEVLSRCEARKGTVIPMKKTRNRTWKSLVAACLTLVVLLGGGGGWFYQQSYAVASVISLDVNPSIEMNVNRKGEVIACTALNEEAADVLTDYTNGEDLEGVKLKVAVNAIVTSMLSRGYLTDLTSAILISVEDKDQARAARLQQELTASVDVTLQEASSQAAILSQTLTQNTGLTQQAQAHQISTGKAYLVQQVIQKNSALTGDDVTVKALSALGIEELKDMSERSDVPGLPVDKSQVAQDVLKYAGLDEVTPVGWTVDPELDERIPHYEVDVHYDGEEYEYLVDAYTGEILSGPKNVLKTQAAKPDAPKPPVSTQNQMDETEALDLAAAHFYTQYPELKGKHLMKTWSELDFDDGKYHYDVEFYVDGYEVDYEIDADTGAVLEWDTEYEAPKPQIKPETQPAPQKPAATGDIGQEAAKTTALNHAGVAASQVFELQVEWDMDDGRLEYEVEFKANGMEYEYTIDGSTGVILEHEADWDD